MISSNSHKYLFFIFFALMLTASCRFCQTDPTRNKIQDPESEIQTDIPFSTKEPENFQADIVVTTVINGKTAERRYLIAKNGNRSLHTFDLESENERSILRLEDKTILIENKSKSYREISKENSANFIDDSLIKNLISKWLNEKVSASFVKLEVENGLTKYRVNLDSKTNSEILIFIDEKIQLPVRQEFYSIVENKIILNYTIELKNFKLLAEEQLFELPKDHKEIN